MKIQRHSDGKLMTKRVFKESVGAIALLLSLTPQRSLVWAQAISESALHSSVVRHLSAIDLQPSDLEINSSTDVPYQVRSVEVGFRSPLTLADQSEHWLDDVQNSTTPTRLLYIGSKILDGETQISTASIDAPELEVPPAVAPGLANALTRLYHELARAQFFVSRATNSVSSEARSSFLSLYGLSRENRLIADEISPLRIHAQYDDMKSFREQDMLAGGQIALAAVDRFVAEWANTSETWSSPRRIVWNTPLGRFLIATPDDDTFTDNDLEGTAFLFDPGGNNSYVGSPGAATSGQIRIVVDWGQNVTIDGTADNNAGAASGVFGIGAVFLPNIVGTKKISSGSVAQGCGLGGVGALIIHGKSQVSGRRYVQGSGAFGAGVFLLSEGSRSQLVAERDGQGLGLVRGVGIFSVEGSSAEVKGGLVEPDPREALASVSLCQGVGYGHRGYTGGGVGLAVIKGNSNRILGSYFSQGCGYWHALGGFRSVGDNSLIQARRYDQGAGVHNAFGYFSLVGNSNRLINWGVGPAYGWDRGMGAAVVDGSENEIQAEWGTGMASIGSLSFSLIHGDRNKLKLPQWSSGSFFRNEFGYSIHEISGNDNSLNAASADSLLEGQLLPTPWGVTAVQSMHLAPLKLTPAEWPTIPAATTAAPSEISLPSILERSKHEKPLQRIADLVDVAAAFGLDKETPRRALKELLAQKSDTPRFLLSIFDPAAVEQLIQIHIALAAYGDDGAKAALEAVRTWGPSKKRTIILSWLAMYRPSLVLSTLMRELNSGTERQQAVAAGALGTIYNRDSGQEPGARAMLESLQDFVMTGSTLTFGPAVARLRIPEAYTVLTTAHFLNPETRPLLIANGPSDITETVGNSGAAYVLKFIQTNGRQSMMRIADDLDALRDNESKVRKKLVEMLKSTDTAVVTTAVVALGQIGNPDDVGQFVPLVNHSSAKVRRNAIVALARMGEPGWTALIGLFDHGSELQQRRVLEGVTQSATGDAGPILERGLHSPFASVRLLAIACIGNLPPSLDVDRVKFLAAADKALQTEKDPSVRVGLKLIQR